MTNEDAIKGLFDGMSFVCYLGDFNINLLDSRIINNNQGNPLCGTRRT